FQKSLDASREILTSGPYSLYEGSADPRRNFYEMGVVKGNSEIIWTRDYGQGLVHLWTMNAVPKSMTLDITGSGLSPTLQLIEDFDYLDGTPGTIPGVGSGSNTA